MELLKRQDALAASVDVPFDVARNGSFGSIAPVNNCLPELRKVPLPQIPDPLAGTPFEYLSEQIETLLQLTNASYPGTRYIG
jgi:hypothetical protein